MENFIRRQLQPPMWVVSARVFISTRLSTCRLSFLDAAGAVARACFFSGRVNGSVAPAGSLREVRSTSVIMRLHEHPKLSDAVPIVLMRGSRVLAASKKCVLARPDFDRVARLARLDLARCRPCRYRRHFGLPHSAADSPSHPAGAFARQNGSKVQFTSGTS